MPGREKQSRPNSKNAFKAGWIIAAVLAVGGCLGLESISVKRTPLYDPNPDNNHGVDITSQDRDGQLEFYAHIPPAADVDDLFREIEERFQADLPVTEGQQVYAELNNSYNLQTRDTNLGSNILIPAETISKLLSNPIPPTQQPTIIPTANYVSAQDIETPNNLPNNDLSLEDFLLPGAVVLGATTILTAGAIFIARRRQNYLQPASTYVEAETIQLPHTNENTVALGEISKFIRLNGRFTYIKEFGTKGTSQEEKNLAVETAFKVLEEQGVSRKQQAKIRHLVKLAAETTQGQIDFSLMVDPATQKGKALILHDSTRPLFEVNPLIYPFSGDINSL